MTDRNAVLTRREAQEAIDALGYANPPDLAKRAERGNGPDFATSKSGRVTYRWGDVLDWLGQGGFGKGGFTNYVRCDLTGTRLGRWILKHRLTVPAFAARVNLSPHTVYKLVGHRNNERTPDASVLELVSLETGIAVGALVEDAIGIKREDAA